MRPAIKINNLLIELNKQPILQDISIEIPAGQITGILGPSGAGKTTLMRTIVGRQRKTSGQITVLGQPAGSSVLRKNIGYMTQGTSVYPDLTVRENIRYFAAMRSEADQQIDEAIDQVGLTDHAHQLVSRLSGGQKSRVSLAAALLGKPKLLVLDEPTVGVDPVLRGQLWDIFSELARAGTAILISSHVMDEAIRCHNLLLIRDGRVLAAGSPTDLLQQTNSQTIEDSFLKLVGGEK